MPGRTKPGLRKKVDSEGATGWAISEEEKNKDKVEEEREEKKEERRKKKEERRKKKEERRR